MALKQIPKTDGSEKGSFKTETLNSYSLFAKDNFQILKSATREELISFFASKEFYNAIHDIAKNSVLKTAIENEREIISVISKMFKDKAVWDVFQEAYDNNQSTRYAFAELYNSPIGMKIVGRMVLDPINGWPTIKKLITLQLKPKNTEDEFLHMAYPEEKLHITENNKEVFSVIEIFLSTGNPESLNTFKGFDSEIVKEVIRTGEFRELCKFALKDEKSRKRLLDIMFNGKEALYSAMLTPEGMNTVGYLLALEEGKKFVVELLKTGLKGLGLVVGIVKTQMQFNSTIKETGQYPVWVNE